MNVVLLWSLSFDIDILIYFIFFKNKSHELWNIDLT